jgi:hypothetical protein
LKKTPVFFAENWQKSQKIVIVTSTPETIKASSFLAAKHIFCHIRNGLAFIVSDAQFGNFSLEKSASAAVRKPFEDRSEQRLVSQRVFTTWKLLHCKILGQDAPS